MEYIIEPRWFYWISIVDSLKMVCGIGMMISVLVIAVDALVLADAYTANEKKCAKTIFVTAAAVFLLLLNGLIFIPSKETLIQMQIARLATYDNAEWTIDAIKSAADHIITTIKSLQ